MSEFFNTMGTNFNSQQCYSERVDAFTPQSFQPVLSAKKPASKKRKPSRSKSKKRAEPEKTNCNNKENNEVNVETPKSYINPVKFDAPYNDNIWKTKYYDPDKTPKYFESKNPALQYLLNQKNSYDETELDLSCKNDEELDLSCSQINADQIEGKQPYINEEEALDLSGRILIDEEKNIGYKHFSFLKFAKKESEQEVSKLQKQLHNSIY